MYTQALKELLSILPCIEKRGVKCEADYYGASSLITKKLHLPFTPMSTAGWKHGWLTSDVHYIENLTYGNNEKTLVALTSQEEFAKKKGIEAKAIGMPFTYVEDLVTEKITRINKSLLVMPPHSLPYTEHQWDEDLYAQQINDLKTHFELIVVCIHQSCIQKKLWLNAFQKYKISYIIGADALDKNSLIRMYKLFKSFEFMTTNTIGSHVPYAAYCGCKVSIYGKYMELSEIDCQNDPFYNRFPFLLAHNLKNSSKESIEKRFPFLFCSPPDAAENILWAEEQLGKTNKVSFYELAKLLGWLPQDQFLFYIKRIYSKIKSIITKLNKRQRLDI